MVKKLKERLSLYSFAWFLLLIAPFSYCGNSCNGWGMPFVSIVMLIASIPCGIVDVFLSVAGYPLSSVFLFNAALAVSYLMVISMAWILGLNTEVFLETIKDRFKNKI